MHTAATDAGTSSSRSRLQRGREAEGVAAHHIHRRPGERSAAGQPLVEHDAGRVDIRLEASGLPQSLLRGHVQRCPHHGPLARQGVLSLGPAEDRRDSEVHEDKLRGLSRRSMFAGFRSRCRTSLAWAAARPASMPSAASRSSSRDWKRCGTIGRPWALNKLHDEERPDPPHDRAPGRRGGCGSGPPPEPPGAVAGGLCRPRPHPWSTLTATSRPS